MKFADILRMAIHNLRRRRMRTLLNLLGVVIGCTLLLMTVAGGRGVGVALRGLLDSSEYAKQIRIFQNYDDEAEVPEAFTTIEGEMSDARRQRIQEAMKDVWREENVPRSTYRLNADDLDGVEQIPHVVEVVPNSLVNGVVRSGDVSLLANFEGCGALDRDIADRVIAGRMFRSNDGDEILVYEHLAYRLGFRSDQDLEELIGRELSFTYGTSGMRLGGLLGARTNDTGFNANVFQKQVDLAGAVAALMGDLDATSLDEAQKKLLTEAIAAMQGKEAGEPQDQIVSKKASETAAVEVAKSTTFRVVGIVRSATETDPWALFRQFYSGRRGTGLIGFETARRLQVEAGDDNGFYQAKVTIDSTAHLAQTVKEIEKLGIGTSSAIKIMENVDREISQITWGLLAIAIGILLIACLGISNTLVISVMERTPELGIMKSLGARDSHILLLLLTEGAFLGAIGALISSGVSWLLATIGDGILKSYVENQVAEELQSGLFSFSLVWLAGVGAISVVVCMLASLLPAWRASRLDPVVAMRRT